MGKGYFVTGTDTDVGKTWATIALMCRFRRQGFSVAGMKPVAAGCNWLGGELKNQDALLIQQHSVPPLTYRQVNPYAFELPVSPHLACGNVEVGMSAIVEGVATLKRRADIVLVEGAGGWLSPLSSAFDNAVLARTLKIPVILVVGMRLGCINHARLTFQAIRWAGVECAGWVAVEIAPDRIDFAANLEFLKQHLDVPLLGVLPYLAQEDFEFLAGQLNI